VYPDNRIAVELYRTLGYVFGAELEHGQLVGRKDLGSQG
jgi:ribosomal protein S18 acetylase RimI-like enzyme